MRPQAPPHATQEFVDWTEVTLTQRCNQRCWFCYEDARHNATDPSFEEVQRLLRETRKRADQVVLCGKEVLMRRDVLDVVGYGASLGLRVVVFTNGQALARPGLVGQLAEAGCASVTVSFHFPDREAFARGTRTDARGFDRTLAGLGNLARHNVQHPERPLGISTETAMSALNAGRLAEMRALLMSALSPSAWKMRLSMLLPSRSHDIGLSHALSPFAERRAELEAFVTTHPAGLPLHFVKTPLCLLPAGVEHRDLEVEYVHHGTALTFNHGDPENITTDTITPSATRDVGASLAAQPYRWLCRRCPLVALCRFEHVDWTLEQFLPTRAQRPQPRHDTTAAEVLARLGAPDAALARLAALQRTVPAEPFPEEALLEGLREVAGEALGEVWIHERPVLAVELDGGGQRLPLRLGAPLGLEGNRPLGLVVDYLDVQPLAPEQVTADALRGALRLLAKAPRPEPAAWRGVGWFDPQVASLLRAAWARLGEVLWPGLGALGAWRTASASLGGDLSVRVELTRAPAGRAHLVFRAAPERLTLTLDARGERRLDEAAYTELEQAVRALAGAVPVELRRATGPLPPPRQAPAAGAPKNVLARAPRLLLAIAAGAPAARYQFEVTSHAPGRPCFKVVGPLALSHGKEPLDARGLAVAGAVLAVMARLADQPLGAGCEPAWRSLLEPALAGSGYELELRWDG